MHRPQPTQQSEAAVSPRRKFLMKTINSFRLAAVLTVALLAAFAVMLSRPHAVKAAPPSGGGVAGTIKLDGVAPHQKPIDMSKEPSCAAIHKDHPITDRKSTRL